MRFAGILDKGTGYGRLRAMIQTTTTEPGSAAAGKKAALNGFAIVGFGALIVAGIFLAIYAARYVPEALSRLSSAVILSSDGGNDGAPATTTPSTTKPAATATTTKPVTTPTTPVIYTTPTRVVTQTGPKLYGLPDLTLINVEGGYMRGSTFIEDDNVPDGRDAALRFTVRNSGTNIASGWKVRVEVEDEDTAIGSGGTLYPNGTQNFSLRVTDPKQEKNKTIQIEVDYQNRVAESNERNNEDSLDLDIERD